MIEQSLSQLRQLKLNGMAGALQIQQEQPGTYEGLAFAERLQLLIDQETQQRQQRKQERLIQMAQFKLKAHPQGIDYQHKRPATKPNGRAAVMRVDHKSAEPFAHRSLRQRQNLSRLRPRPPGLS